MYSCVNLRETTSDIPTNLFGGEILFPSQPFLFCAGCKENNVWLLCGNLPVLANAQNLRPASDAEALARSLLRGEMVEVPGTVVGDQSQQQSFVDASRVIEDAEEGSREKKSRRVETIPDGILEEPEEGTWEIPDDVLVELGILHQNDLGEVNQEEEDHEEGEDALTELQEAATSSDRVRRNDTAETSRNVRPRTGEPEAESEESRCPSLEETHRLDLPNHSRGQERITLTICLFSSELILRGKLKGMAHQKKKEIEQPLLHSWQTDLNSATERMKCRKNAVPQRMDL